MKSSSVRSASRLSRISAIRRPLAWPTLSLRSPRAPFQPTRRLSPLSSHSCSSAEFMLTTAANSCAIRSRSKLARHPPHEPRDHPLDLLHLGPDRLRRAQVVVPGEVMHLRVGRMRHAPRADELRSLALEVLGIELRHGQ